MSSDEDDLVFKALADGRRRRMLDLLKDAPRTTGELVGTFADEIDRCTVMQHIGVLERAGLVLARREGRTRWNHLNAGPFIDIHDRWIGPYAQAATQRLARLRAELEG
jgi:DNA-binding transcriptional ArsR family regulator